MYVYDACFYVCCSDCGNVCSVAAVVEDSILLKCVCLGNMMVVLFSVRIVLVYGKCECLVMQMLYDFVLCTACGSSQCCVLHDLQYFLNAG